MLVYNSMSLEGIGHLKFNTIISSKNLNGFIELSFDHSLKGL